MGIAAKSHEPGEGNATPEVSNRVLTIPNALSFLRLVGVPFFLWAIIDHRDGLALVLLMVSGITDYLDGKIARAFNMTSRVGQLLDPIADRLYIFATLVGLGWRDIVPWWVVGLLVGRDVVMAVLMAILKAHGQTGLPVHFVGKAATFNLLYAFPVLLIAQFGGAWERIGMPVGWAFAWWGIGLYWLGAAMYIAQAATVLGGRRPVAS